MANPTAIITTKSKAWLQMQVLQQSSRPYLWCDSRSKVLVPSPFSSWKKLHWYNNDCPPDQDKFASNLISADAFQKQQLRSLTTDYDISISRRLFAVGVHRLQTKSGRIDPISPCALSHSAWICVPWGLPRYPQGTKQFITLDGERTNSGLDQTDRGKTTTTAVPEIHILSD